MYMRKAFVQLILFLEIHNSVLYKQLQKEVGVPSKEIRQTWHPNIDRDWQTIGKLESSLPMSLVNSSAKQKT